MDRGTRLRLSELNSTPTSGKTASMSFNNCSSGCNGKYLAFSHKHLVQVCEEELLSSATEECKEITINASAKTTDIVTQAKWCEIAGVAYLVVASVVGLRIYTVPFSGSASEMELVCIWTPDKQTGKGFERELCEPPFRGIACPSPPSSSDCLMVGSSTGGVIFFHVEGKDFEFDQVVKGHDTAVTCMGGGANCCVSGDQDGNTTVWSAVSKAEQCRLKGDGHPATSCHVRKDRVFVAYSTGNIKIFLRSTQSVAVEIAAHARCIWAMDIHPYKNWIASVGEDTMLNVFEFPEQVGNLLSLLFSSLLFLFARLPELDISHLSSSSLPS